MGSKRIRIETGAELYEIEDAYGEVIGQFKFDPSDMSILDRVDSAKDMFDRIKESSKEMDYEELSNGVKEAMNYLLGYDVANGIFAKCSPLSITPSGDFFFEQVYVMIGNLIQQSVDERIQKGKQRIAKYTEKYE